MNNSYKLKLKSKTWSKDSYDLYDYESTDLNNEDFEINEPGFMIRKASKLKYMNDNSLLPDNKSEILFYIDRENDIFRLSKGELHDIWCILNNKYMNNNTGTYLKENDKIKLGRIIFIVKKIKNLEDKETTSISYYNSIMASLKENYEFPELKKNSFSSNSKSSMISNSDDKKLCRFCLSDTILTENPLLNPCKCDGSMKYVHLFCLQNWLVNKLHLKKNKGVISILWQNLSCELCKSILPLTLSYKDQIYDLINLNSFENEKCDNTKISLTLESLSKEGKPIGLHFIELYGNNHITIGRGNECEIKLTDISVSRLHAKICYENKKIVLKDNNAKFGTLINFKNPLFIDENSHVFLQFGRTILEISSKKKWFSNYNCIMCFEKK